MAATRKSAKRGAGKKRKTAKRASAKKRSSRRRSGSKKAARLKRTARKGLRAARGGLTTVRRAGERTWETLKSTTAQVVEGVKDRFADERQSDSSY